MSDQDMNAAEVKKSSYNFDLIEKAPLLEEEDKAFLKESAEKLSLSDYKEDGDFYQIIKDEGLNAFGAMFDVEEPFEDIGSVLDGTSPCGDNYLDDLIVLKNLSYVLDELTSDDSFKLDYEDLKKLYLRLVTCLYEPNAKESTIIKCGSHFETEVLEYKGPKDPKAEWQKVLSYRESLSDPFDRALVLVLGIAAVQPFGRYWPLLIWLAASRSLIEDGLRPVMPNFAGDDDETIMYQWMRAAEDYLGFQEPESLKELFISFFEGMTVIYDESNME